ncbi:MAG TPA: STN and carboxypeptidase regulatory-like domain-containing protein, partial [Flavitalea sp.]|nr:STN and carboxypeptidase regulatory-like domain-containing protein [Flavitalea sp.]
MKRRAGANVTAILIILFFSTKLYGQTYLNKMVSLEVSKQPLDQVLEILSNKGNFYFSYNSNIVPRDTLITISENNKTVKQILDLIFKSGFEFRESGNYIIIRRTPIQLTLITTKAITEDNNYTVSGYIVDDQTGKKVSYASIYEKQRLASAITNEQGFFRIKLKSKYRTASLTVSKEFYEDTTVVIEPKFNQQITITIMPLEITEQSVIISPKNYEAPNSITIAVQQNDSVRWLYTYRKTDSVRVEKTKLGDWLLSSKLKFQTINLKKFFTARPYQFSFTPGLSTNGAMNGQVINNFSVNLFGGYSGGLNGFEIGGLFNINKMDARYVQAGGVFNVVGGKMEGVQLAGIHNSVLKS